MFAAARLVLLTKTDLLPHLDFELGRAVANVRAANPHVVALPLSARTGEGMAKWHDWLRAQLAAAREAALA